MDTDPDSAVLLDTMDATGRWGATVELRAFERDRSGARAGQRLLDVGCGCGDAAINYADRLGPTGGIVGIDASAAMVDAARTRARSLACEARFIVGDAHALPEPDASFDIVRAERTLQWLARPDRAVAEMVRVLRPGGRLALIDTDWSSFLLDVDDPVLSACVHDAMQVERARPSNIGRRLADIVTDFGLDLVGRTSAVQRWQHWDPDGSPAPEGCFSMTSLAQDLVERGLLDPADQERFVSTVHRAARTGRFRMELTVHAVVATVPRQAGGRDGA